jgi:hypothetical protein
MAEFTVFYAWQSDLPRKLTRDVIHEAATQAVKRLKLDVSLEDAPRLDHDTQNVPGVPEIASTIFRKIDQCGVFLADVTFVATTAPNDPSKTAKRLPNPNVVLELGYAAARVGWDRVILVMNTEYGPPEDLIFDLRHRRFPLTFRLSSSTRKDVSTVQQNLSKRIEEAIRAALQSQHAAVQDAVSQLDMHGFVWMREAGQSDYFSVAQRTTMGEILSAQRSDAALIRLLDLKLVRCDVVPGGNKYVYHWTYLGKLVLKQLGFRK